MEHAGRSGIMHGDGGLPEFRAFRRLLRQGVALLATLLAMGAASSAVAAPPPFGGLPLDLAIKEVRGSGNRQLVIFDDPTCPYCRKLTRELQGVTDITIYSFVYPILSAESRSIAHGVWCAPNPAAAWHAWADGRVRPAASRCTSPVVEQVLALGRSRAIRSVPAIFLADGTRLPSGTSMMNLEMAISAPKVMMYSTPPN